MAGDHLYKTALIIKKAVNVETERRVRRQRPQSWDNLNGDLDILGGWHLTTIAGRLDIASRHKWDITTTEAMLPSELRIHEGHGCLKAV